MLAKVPDGIDKREGSVIYNALAPAAAELAQAYLELEFLLDEGFADTAFGLNLERRVGERGLTRRGATKAGRKARLIGADVEPGTRFSGGDVNYRVIEKIPGADNEYRLESETPGAIGNLYTGILFPIEYSALSSAELTDVLVPGEDEESDDDLRRRFFLSFESQAFGGNIADYKEKTDAIAGVGGVKVYPAKSGAGTVGLTIISAEYTAPSSELIQQVQNAVDPVAGAGTGKGFAPIGHRVTVSGVTETVINITTTITYASSWNFSTAKSHIEKAIDDYFKELAKMWADSETLVVRIAQIESRLLLLDAVLDISGTRLNGTASNVQLDKDAIPNRGTLNG